MVNEIRNKVLKTEQAEWRKFKFIQSDTFKVFPPELAVRLRESMVSNHFIESFKVWKDGKDIYCLDGYHRCLVLKELEQQGFTIPDKFPCEFIACADRSEAARLVLVYSSSYTTISKDMLSEFVDDFKLDIDALGDILNLPLTSIMDDDEQQDGGPVPQYPIVPRFSEKYDYVVIFCKNEIDFTNLAEMMKLRTEKSNKNTAVGIGRVITSERFMELWRERK